ncbi:MAG: zinc ABC transporter substrate-binding protein [Pseudomonadota bacterium]
MKSLPRFAATLAMSTLLTGYSVSTTLAADDTKLGVVTSFSVLGDLTSRVGGERVSVSTLVGPGEDAHVYEPTPADAARVAEADVVIVNGLEFEGFIDRLIEASATKARIVTATSGITPLKAKAHSDDEHDDHDDHAKEGHDDHAEAGQAKKEHAKKDHDDHDDHGDEEAGHNHGEFDPHAWHAVPNVRNYVATIADGLCAVDAKGCPTYRSNAQSYTQELDNLQAEITATFAAIPKDRRTIIVSHDAFGYLANAYDLTFLAPLGLSTESEASAADVARLIDQVRKDGASALFVENVSNPRLIERIAAETGLEIGGTLYSDALSDSSGPASTYLDMMRHNSKTIATAIQGS